MIVKKGSIYYVVVKYKNNNEEWKKKWIRAGTSRRDAQRLERKYESDRDAGIPIVDRNTSFTLREFFSQWLDSSIKPPSRSLGTYENYIYCADKICAHIGNVRIDRLTPLHLTRTYRALLASGLGATTVRMCHRVTRAALNKAVKWDMIRSNPALSADLPERTKSPAKALDRDQAISLLEFSETVNVYANLIVALEMLCGLRDAEVCGLRWDDYDRDTSRLYIRHNLCRRSLDGIDPSLYEFVWKQGKKYLVLDKAKTEASCNFIILPEYVSGVIAAARARYQQKKWLLRSAFIDAGFILCGDTGAPRADYYVYQTVQKLVAGYNKAHPESPLPKIRAHDLRHTAATLLLEEHVDIKYVSRQLRHSSTNITQNLYQHVTDRMASLPAHTIDRMLKKAEKA